MKKNVLKSIALLVVLGIVFATACKKKDTTTEEETTTPTADYSASSDNSQCENMSNDIVNMSTDALSSNSSVNKSISGTGCASVTKDTAKKTVTITFDENVTCKDSVKRGGKIIISYVGTYPIPGSSLVVTLDNYKVNGYKIEGKHSLTFKSVSLQKTYTFEIKAENMKVTQPDGKFKTWNSTRTRTWEYGKSYFMVKGNASGTTVDGKTYTAVTTKDIKVDGTCKYVITEGSIKITYGETKYAYLEVDFGAGTCDPLFTVKTPAIPNSQPKTYDITKL